MRKFAFLLVFQSCFLLSNAQFSLTGNYSQDFNSLLSTGSGSILPEGWVLQETGTASDAMYTAGTGSGSTGDTYSFGVLSSPERALGMLQSGTLTPVVGFHFINTTGQLITRITVSFTGEQWRLGSTGRNDRLDFQFSLNAGSLVSGDWVDLDILDFIAPVSNGQAGAMDGNAVVNKRLISATITGLFIEPGNTCFFRWTDAAASGSDDGLGIDDLSIEPGYALPSTQFYRTKSSGSWSSLSSWEVSADELSWTDATELPTWYAAGIRIRNGHSITHQYFTMADQITIDAGGLLQHGGGQLLLNDGAGDELQIESGGIFQLAATGNLPLFGNSTASLRIKSGGILRISAGGLTTVPGAGVHAANYVYEDAAVLENAYNGMGTNGVTYFPHVSNSTIPILRISQPVTLPVGASAVTRVNGILEVNASISFTAAGQKQFRNGISGTGALSTTASCGVVLVDGLTAVLGGTVQLNLSASAGLQVGSGTTITLQQDKTISGNLALAAAASYINLDGYQLTVTGLISGAGSSSYIRTAGTGALVLENVGVSGKFFPVGHSRYNPVLIEKGNGHHWSVRVNDGVVPDFPYSSDGAVLLTWYIQPSVNPPLSGADITFQFDQLNQTGSLFNTSPYELEPVQAWHRHNGYWLTAAVPQPLVQAGGDTRTVKINGLTRFSAYGLSRISLPLPVRLISFQATTSTGEKSSIEWRIAEPGMYRFIPEYSINGIDFFALDTIRSMINQTAFHYLDKRRESSFLYYRLKMLHMDETVQYSQVITLNKEERGYPLLQLNANPVTQQTNLQVISLQSVPANLQIVDPSGKCLYNARLLVKKGTQHFSINLVQLPAGLYFLQLQGETWKKSIRFIKQ